MNSLDKDSILKLILGFSKDERRKSTLQLALTEARHLIGFDISKKSIQRIDFEFRNPIDPDEDAKSDCFNTRDKGVCDVFTALILYLVALDQLGHVFINNKKNVKICDLLKLSNVSQFKDRRILNAVKNFRNSLCHNFGLANNKRPFYKFTIDYKDREQILKLPQKTWKGVWNDKTEETQTIVYIFPLCNALEQVIDSITHQYTIGEISSSLSLEELKTRFTIITN